ncbi:hypothetical protein GWI33_004261 [Rhynchophorus ferrugineus]|uniref:Uncharacterized protein n=1 Tax=Rhynchophorus ferrugineus TaxID=354439 RepID=A0A834INA8_RHYFE|nr:hypothetical protein GWI33_004261 [Rhynchophorus ferrugineus]
MQLKPWGTRLYQEQILTETNDHNEFRFSISMNLLDGYFVFSRGITPIAEEEEQTTKETVPTEADETSLMKICDRVRAASAILC